MLTIRLQRTGKKNQADFRIVLAEKESPVNKKIVEILGSYNPRKKNVQVKEERVKYWIGQKIEMSETVHNLFVTKSLLDAKKIKAFTIPKKPVEPVKPEATASSSAEATADKPVAAVETPAEAVEAVAEVEAKIETPAEVAEAKPKETPVA